MSVPAASTTASELHSSLSDLSLSTKAAIKDIPRPIPKKKAPVIADSWEDEADTVSSSDELASSSNNPDTALSPSVTAEGPLDPPPTPISPQTSNPWPATPAYTNSGSTSRASDSRSPTPSRRPEKQTAVAGRMIAGALGLRAPKRTEEQRAYDRAVKEQEIKRRNREREEAAKAKEAEEQAKAAVWDE
ncbi:predicted protein [Aspergillus terreus NIH2624]|uniref:Uncharacterized protein n=1 Tax=Aspergillus terreus (strain NIH 2624 / FGSC A1156) TaxID=341663 RepID=Q0D1A8_ASPTN|nr:uncharacterized protein ATEG_00276 [Aspergillus terreus NIH2624]EAU38922.1 predicted protein [Aspergillus terreus NIH2624]